MRPVLAWRSLWRPAMPISPLIQQRIQALRTAAIDFQPGTEGLANTTGSDTFERLKATTGDVGLQRMFERGQWVKKTLDPFGDGAHPEAPRPESLLQLRARQGRLSKPSVTRSYTQNAYDPAKNQISLIDPARVPFAAHELRHATDHLTRQLDLHTPSHRLAAEERAFQTQIDAARELREDAGISGRTAAQQARTYEGKPGYLGTLDASRDAVAAWRTDT